jgi:acyl-CoA thioesterase
MAATDDTITRHPFDDASAVARGDDGRLTGHTNPDYFAFVGPFGGITAATLLRAVVEHPDSAGDPLALTVNYCAPIAPGAFDLVVRLLKGNRSTQHWSVELQQDDSVAAFATIVLAQRRETWAHQPARMPDAPPFERTPAYPTAKAAPWVQQFDFRFAEGAPNFSFGTAKGEPGDTLSRVWIGHKMPRRIDAVSLAAISDAFFARIFHVRGELVPFGTVSLTTYFHVDAADLANEGITHVLGVTDGNVFHKSYSDQTGELWSAGGRLLATTQQIAYFKA